MEGVVIQMHQMYQKLMAAIMELKIIFFKKIAQTNIDQHKSNEVIIIRVREYT